MQSTLSTNMAIGRAGLVADNRDFKHIASKLAFGRIQAGKGVFRYPTAGNPGSGDYLNDPGRVYQLPNPAAAADVDAIVATGVATATSEVVIDSGDADGVVGVGEMFPPRKITVALSNHADYDATTAVLRGYDQTGALVSENLSIPNGGNTTLTSTLYYRSFLDLTIPAQSGTGGSTTLGIAAIDASVTLADFEGIAIYDATVVPAATTGAFAAEYEDMSVVPCMRKGAIWVVTEDACSPGDDVFCRGAVGSGSILGSFRNDNDSSSCFQITGARFARSSSAGELNIVELF